MTDEEQINKLKAAEALINQVKDSLSTEQTKCGCCGIMRFVDFDAKQMRDQLNAATHRIQQVVKRINEPSNDSDQ